MQLSSCLDFRKQSFHAPSSVVSPASRRRRLDGRMDAAEVVVGEEQGQHRVVVLPLLAVRVRQPSDPANLHAERLVVPLDVRRANQFFIGIASLAIRILLLLPSAANNGAIFRRGVVYLDERREVDACFRRPAGIAWRYGCNRPSSAGIAARGLAEIVSEDVGVSWRSFANMPCQEQFRVPLNRRERLDVAVPVFGVVSQPRLLFQPQKPTFRRTERHPPGYSESSSSMNASHFRQPRPCCSMIVSRWTP